MHVIQYFGHYGLELKTKLGMHRLYMRAEALKSLRRDTHIEHNYLPEDSDVQMLFLVSYA